MDEKNNTDVYSKLSYQEVCNMQCVQYKVYKSQMLCMSLS